MTEVVYGRRPVLEALRGRREVGQVWCTARSRESLDWLPERVSVEPPERLDARAGSEEHQGVVAEVAPYPYAGAAEVLGGERPLVVALDEVTDPHNLGAVARVAECAGAGGLVMTRRRSAAVTAAVCRASAGAVEHLRIARVENLAEFLLDAKRPGLWSYAAAAVLTFSDSIRPPSGIATSWSHDERTRGLSPRPSAPRTKTAPSR